ncbi:MAG TPA: EF-hand domain-containing protein [Rhizomicrobium sp.]|jgi:Ca2+-binding EF-hand superfamily protein
MKQTIRYGLLLTAALAVGTGVAVARMGGSSAPAAHRQNTNSGSSVQTYTGRGRFSQKFLAEFDSNGDGKVTHDEFNRTLAHEFSTATKGAPAMTLDEYAGIYQKDSREQAAADFHRIDWNGDGRITADEYMAAEHDRFEQMDRDGTGVISCASSRGGRSAGTALSRSRSSSSSGPGAGARGRSSLCFNYDTNRDGKVTRAEFDKLTGQQFNAFAKGGSLNAAQYIALVAAQSRTISERVFQRLDKDRDGKLTLAEFAASRERLFSRLDKNNDGTVTEDEMTTSRRSKLASRN